MAFNDRLQYLYIVNCRFTTATRSFIDLNDPAFGPLVEYYIVLIVQPRQVHLLFPVLRRRPVVEQIPCLQHAAPTTLPKHGRSYASQMRCQLYSLRSCRYSTGRTNTAAGEAAPAAVPQRSRRNNWKLVDGGLIRFARVYVTHVPFVGCLESMVEGNSLVCRLLIAAQHVVICFFKGIPQVHLAAVMRKEAQQGRAVMLPDPVGSLVAGTRASQKQKKQSRP